MKYSEITTADINEYLRVEGEDNLVNTLLTASKIFVKNYTGLSDEQLDVYEDLTVVIMILCSEMYDNRQFTLNYKNMANPAVKMILDLYCMNLL